MYFSNRIIKLISIVVVTTFLFTNSTQAALTDVFSREKLAVDSRHEVNGVVGNEQDAAKEEVAQFLRIIVDRLRQERGPDIAPQQLVVALREACQMWKAEYAKGKPKLELDLDALIETEIALIIPQAVGAEFAVGEVSAETARVAQLVNVSGLLPDQRDQGEIGDCAVFCHVGPPQSEENALDSKDTMYKGGKELEHRGYQSSGCVTIGTREDGSVITSPRVTTLAGADALRHAMEAIPQEALDNAKVRMVHLRWPTTSSASHANQHPITVGNREILESQIEAKKKTIEEHRKTLESSPQNPLALRRIEEINEEIKRLEEAKVSVSIMFNGDVTNFDVLDNWLEQKAEELGDNNLRRPENVGTDAWTISALTYYHYMYETDHRPGEQDDLLKAIRMAYARMEGYFALVIGSTNFPDAAFGLVKGDMPLYIGLGENRPGSKIGNFFSSEPGAIVRWARYTQKVQDGDIAVITENSANVYRLQDGEIQPISRVIPEDITTAMQTKTLPTEGVPKEYKVTELNPEEYMYVLEPGMDYYFTQEIYYQPAALAATIWGYIPHALYPDKMLYDMDNHDLVAMAQHRDRFYQIVIDQQRLPTDEEAEEKKPTISENRVGVLRQWIENPDRAREANLVFPGVNAERLPVRRIKDAKKLLFACSGTAGHSAKAQRGMLEDVTGMDVEVKSGTEYVDNIDSKLRRVFKALKRNNVPLNEFMTAEETNEHFPGEGFKGKAEVADLIFLIRVLNNVINDARFANISEFNIFRKLVQEAKETVGVAVSQSGTTKDTLNVVSIGQALGVRFLSIINRPGVTDIGSKTEEDGGLLLTYAGTERGVASTKAHTCQQALITELGIWLGLARGTLSPEYAREKLDNLLAIPKQVQQILQTVDHNAETNWAKEVAEQLAGAQAIIFFGRGGDDRLFTVAQEGALKLKEETAILAEAQNLGEMKHGPISFFPITPDPNIRKYCVVLLTDSEVFDKAFLNLREIIGRDGRPICLVYSNQEKRVRDFLVGKAEEEIERNVQQVADLRSHLSMMQRRNLDSATFLDGIKTGRLEPDMPDERRGQLMELLTDLARSGEDLGVHIDRLENRNQLLRETQQNIYVFPVAVEDDLSPITTVVPLQVLALETTIDINEISLEVGRLSGRLYWFLKRYREYYSKTNSEKQELDREYGEILNDLEYRWNELLAAGKLGSVDELKLRQARAAMTDAANATNPGDRITRAQRLALALGSGEIIRVGFFENAIQECLPEQGFPEWDKGQLEIARGSLQEAEIEARQEAESQANAEEVYQRRFLEIAHDKLEPIISSTAERQEYVARQRGEGRDVENTRLAELYAGWFREIGVSAYTSRDADKPRGLAKIVTVEDRISKELLDQLVGQDQLGLSLETMTSLSRGIMRSLIQRDEDGKAVGAEVVANNSFLRLVSEIEKKSLAEVIRRSLFHEKMHNLLELLPGFDRQQLIRRIIQALDKVEGQQRRAGKTVFTQKFRERFGRFADQGEFVTEVIMKYYSVKFEETEDDLFDGIGEEIDVILSEADITLTEEHFDRLLEVLRITPADAREKQSLLAQLGNKMPTNLAEAFDIGFVTQFDIGGRTTKTGSLPQALKLLQISKIAQALGAEPKINLEEASANMEAEIEEARRRLVKRRVPQMDIWTNKEIARMENIRGKLMHQGVNIPSSHEELYIGPEVDIKKIGKGTYIHSGTIILGENTSIGENCQVSGTIINCSIGNNVDIINPRGKVVENSDIGAFAQMQNATVSNYSIGTNVAVSDSTLSMTGESSFGSGTVISVGPETGGRDVAIYAEMTYDEAVNVAMNVGNDEIQEAHAANVERYVKGTASKKGKVGKGCRLNGAHHVIDANIGDYAVLDHPITVRNCTVLSSKAEPAVIADGAQVDTAILQYGAEVTAGAIVTNTMIFEYTKAERGVKIEESIVAPNCELGQGEVTACLLGPFYVSHHVALNIGVIAPYGRVNIGAQAAIGSNHPGTRPTQEAWLGEGIFAGVAATMGYPINLMGCQYSMIGRGSNLIAKQAPRFPFSLISRKRGTGGLSKGSQEIIAELGPDFLMLEPAISNPYMMAYNQWKYHDRNKARRHKFDLVILRPEIIDGIIDARNRLESALRSNPRAELFFSEEGTGKKKKSEKRLQEEKEQGLGHIAGLGKNFTTKIAVETGIRRYTDMLSYYALRGLRDRLNRITASPDVTSWDRVVHELTADTEDTRWQHARAVLQNQLSVNLAELTPINASVYMQEVIRAEEQHYAVVCGVMEREYAEGLTVIDDYGAVHKPADQDKFVRGALTLERDESVESAQGLMTAAREQFGPQMQVAQIVESTRVPDNLLLNEDRHARSLNGFLRRSDVAKVAPNKMGFILSAQYVMENPGVREALEKLAQSPVTESVVVVEAENETEKRVIEALGLPLVEVVMAEGADRRERLENLIRQLGSKGVVARGNIALIENPRSDIDEAVGELEELTSGLDIFVGIPQTTPEGQLHSAHKVFRDVIEAIVSEEARPRVFAIKLPAIEIVSDSLQRAFDEYKEAIEFLKRA